MVRGKMEEGGDFTGIRLYECGRGGAEVGRRAVLFKTFA
jgi:hypothetical protein